MGIHQGNKACCGSTSKACLRTPVLHATTGDQGQDTHHRAQAAHAVEENPLVSDSQTESEHRSGQPTGDAHGLTCGLSKGRLPRLKLPKASSAEWKHLDEDLDKVLEAKLRGPASEKIEKLSSTVYEICRDRFGVEEPTVGRPKPSGPSRRQRRIAEIRNHLRELAKQYKTAS